MAPQELVIDGQSLPVAVRDYGGVGRALVLIHGGGHNAATWATVAPTLAESTRVVAVDLRGHGWSPDEEVSSFVADAADVAAVCRSLRLSEPVLVGHSFGGAVAAVCAANSSSYGGIVLLDQPLTGTYEEVAEGPSQEQIASVTSWRGTRAEADERIEQIRVAVSADLGTVAGEVLRETEERALAQGEGDFYRRPTATFLRSMAVADSGHAERRRHSFTSDLYDRIKCPMVLIFGARSELVDLSREVEAKVANRPSTTVAWLDAAHLVHLERPEEVVDLVRGLLRSL